MFVNIRFIIFTIFTIMFTIFTEMFFLVVEIVLEGTENKWKASFLKQVTISDTLCVLYWWRVFCVCFSDMCLPTNCLNVFDHFVKLALKGLIHDHLHDLLFPLLLTAWKHNNTRITILPVKFLSFWLLLILLMIKILCVELFKATFTH